MLRPCKVPQADAAKIAQRNQRRQALADMIDDRLGQQHLASVCRRHDPRRTIDRAAKKIIVPPLDNTEMQPKADAERYPVRCSWVAQGLLERKGGVNRVQWFVERRIHPVAGHLHDDPVVALYSRARQGVVPRERPRHPLPYLLPKQGAPLDIGEQKSCGAG